MSIIISAIFLSIGIALITKPRFFLAIEGMANRLFLGDLSGLRFHGDRNKRKHASERSWTEGASAFMKYPQDSPGRVVLTRAVGGVSVLFGLSGTVIFALKLS